MRQQHFEEAGIKKCQKHMYKIVYILSDEDQAASNAEVVLRSNHPQFTHQTLLDTHLQSDDQHVAERKQMKDDVITICISAHSAVYLHTDDVQGRNLEVRDER